MFGDGLLYASIARNLAEYKGQAWNPFFSSGYWIEGVNPRAYFENPPLMFWMQSLLFSFLGDHWWVEKLYCLLLLLLNCFLISRLWESLLDHQSENFGGFGWLPVLFFYLIPVVVWGSPQNLIDSQLLTFCLLAVYSIIRAIKNQLDSSLWLAIGGVSIFAGLLVKGPVALYPVSVPVLYYLVFNPVHWKKGMLLSSGLLAGVMILFTGLLMLNEPAHIFFRQYWDQRLEVAITGGRADGLRMGWERLYIFWLLLRENSLILSVSVILFFVALKKGIVQKADTTEGRGAIFFFILGSAATLPVMISTRQAGMYLIPGLALFAIAAAYLHLPLFQYWASVMKVKTQKIISGVSILGITLVIIHSIKIFGEPGREQSLLEDLPVMETIIPAGSKVAVCEDVMQNFVYHVYLQRYLKLELTRDVSGAQHFLSSTNCMHNHENEIHAAGFEMHYAGHQLGVYSRPALESVLEVSQE